MTRNPTPEPTPTPARNIPNNLQPFPRTVYEGVNLNWLVLVAVRAVEDSKSPLSFENVVVAAYRLFPEKFALLGFPQYPDAKRIHDALWRCSYKNRQWLRGKTSQGFTFTESGRQEHQCAMKTLQTDYESPKKTFSQTRRAEKLLAEVRASPAYAKYTGGQSDKITDSECCHALQGTLDSDRHVLLDNLTRLRVMAADIGQNELITFIDWLKGRFTHLLEEK